MQRFALHILTSLAKLSFVKLLMILYKVVLVKKKV